MQHFLHYFLHFIFPGIVAYIFYRKNWIKIWLVLTATMIVDLDHLLAEPIFDPKRCSIGFHILHSYAAIAVYIVSLFLINNKVVKLISIGLLFHMLTDYIDCLLMKYGT